MSDEQCEKIVPPELSGSRKEMLSNFLDLSMQLLKFQECARAVLTRMNYCMTHDIPLPKNDPDLVRFTEMLSEAQRSLKALM